MLPPGLGKMQALQDLDLESCDCGGVPPALAALHHLTRLCMCEVNFCQLGMPMQQHGLWSEAGSSRAANTHTFAHVEPGLLPTVAGQRARGQPV